MAFDHEKMVIDWARSQDEFIKEELREFTKFWTVENFMKKTKYVFIEEHHAVRPTK